MGLRVVHIIGGLRVGGAERNLVNLLNAMSCEFRAAVFVGNTSASTSFYSDLDDSIEQHFLRIRGRSSVCGIYKLASLLKKKRVDVVHTHMFYPSLYGVLAARLASVPVIVTTEHGENPWKRSIHRWLERSVISPSADLRFCVSPKILSLRRELDGIPESKLRLIVNGTVLPLSTVKHSEKAILVIGAVGRFISAKNFPLLLRAVSDLSRSGYGVRLQLVGDGPDRDRIKAVRDQLELRELVNLPGITSDIDRCYQSFDIYASSSDREGQPVALLEAMSHGLPIVATDVGAAANTVIDGECGFIVPPNDSKALAGALAKLLDNFALRQSMGKAARERIKSNYSVEQIASAHISAYEEILSKKGLAKVG